MEQTKKKLFEFFDKRTRHSLLLTIVGTLIYSVAVVWLLNSGEFFAGGITGISQLISKAIWGKITPLVGIFIGVINLPLFLFGTRGVSKKFAILTLVSVGLQMVVIALFQMIADNGFNPMSAGEFSKLVKKEYDLDIRVNKVNGKSVRIFKECEE